jgi:hypothetical protein
MRHLPLNAKIAKTAKKGLALRALRPLRSSSFGLALTLLAALPAAAQIDAAALSPMETAVGCAAPVSADDPSPQALRVIGAQDSSASALFGPRELLVVGGGTGAGLQLGQQFFVRRANRFGAPSDRRWQGVRTLGWIRIVAVNDSTAIASVDHVCNAIAQGDYLEPYSAPVVPADADRDVSSGDPDFGAMGKVLAGMEDHQTAGRGEFILINRGTDQGVKPGERYAIYRDIGMAGMPLASIGETVVLSVGKTIALTRITRSRDAIFSGDYVAPRR